MAPDYGAGPCAFRSPSPWSGGNGMALVGRNGSGKSSLLRAALGEEIPHTGLFSLASGLVVSYVPQDASFLRGSLSQFARRYELDETQFKTIPPQAGLRAVQFEKDLSDYSSRAKKEGASCPQPVPKRPPVCVGRAAELYCVFSRCSLRSSWRPAVPPCFSWSMTKPSWRDWPISASN